MALKITVRKRILPLNVRIGAGCSRLSVTMLRFRRTGKPLKGVEVNVCPDTGLTFRPVSRELLFRLIKVLLKLVGQRRRTPPGPCSSVSLLIVVNERSTLPHVARQSAGPGPSVRLKGTGVGFGRYDVQV